MAEDWSISSLKELIEKLITEHDRRYEERFRAVEKTIAKSEETQERALVVAKREADAASLKLGEALTAYKASQNEWQSTFADYRTSIKADTLSKGETLAMFDKQFGLIKNLEADVDKLQEVVSMRAGGLANQASSKRQSNWLVGILVATSVNLLGLIVTWVIYFITRS